MDESVLKRAIIRGVQEGTFGYVGQAHRVKEENGAYQIAREQVTFERTLYEDEIDLNAALLVLPQAIPAAPAATPPPSPEAPTLPTAPAPTPTPAAAPVPLQQPGPGEKWVQLRLDLSMTRQQVYASFNAIGNLAEKAGTIRVIVEAQLAGGFRSSVVAQCGTGTARRGGCQDSEGEFCKLTRMGGYQFNLPFS